MGFWQAKRIGLAGGMAVVLLAGLGSFRQNGDRAVAQAPGLMVRADRIEFHVVESFDAQYLGDTPGHIGRGGGVGDHPGVAVGDRVHRGGEVIGRVSRAVWDRSRQSLEIEFDPEPMTRVAVGDVCWVGRHEPGEFSKPARPAVPAKK